MEARKNSPLGKFVARSRNRLFRLRKSLYWRLPTWRADKQVLFVIGCQRSGTDLLCEVFEQDFRTTSLGEDNVLTGQGADRLRLKPLADVSRIFGTFPTPLVVVKPLVESQRTLELLNGVRNSQAVWTFRHYRDGVNSDVKKFSTQVRGLRAIVDGDPADWRSERVSEPTRELVVRYYSDEMPRADAAALMWYARNILYFEQGLDCEPRVAMCRYEDLTAAPHETMARLYKFLDLEFPGDHVTKMVHANSIGLGSGLAIRAEIEAHCAELQQRLEDAYRRYIAKSAAEAPSP